MPSICIAMQQTEGDVRGQVYLGLCYELGDGVSTAACKASDPYRRTSEAGDPRG